MSDVPNAYEAWLGLPPGGYPPDHYQLLGLPRFEKSARAIDNAAKQRIAVLEQHVDGPYGDQAKKLIGEVTAARVCLLNETRRVAYDRVLLQRVAASVVETERGGGAVRVSAAQFLDLLEEKDLVPQDLLAGLRKEVAGARQFVSASHIAKALIDRGLLTTAIARRLLRSAAQSEGESSAAATDEEEELLQPAKPTEMETTTRSPESPAADTPTTATSSSIGNDEFDLAPLESDDPFAMADPEAERSSSRGATTVGGSSPANQPNSGKDSRQRRSADGGGTKAPPRKQKPAMASQSAGSLLDEELSALDAVAPPLTPVAPRKQTWGRGLKASARLWIWIGAITGAIVLLVAMLIWWASRPNPARLLTRANDHFTAGEYIEAAAAYRRFIGQYPEHEESSRVRIRLGLSELGQSVSGSDPAETCEVATSVLAQIHSEPGFADEAESLLRQWLPTTAIALAGQAEQTRDPADLERARVMLQAIDVYLPRTHFTGTELLRAEESLGRSMRRSAAERELRTAINGIRAAVGSGNIAAALSRRQSLLRRFPEVAKESALRQTEEAVIAAAAARVASLKEALQATTEEPQAWARAETAAVFREIVPPSSAAAGEVIPVSTETSVFGVDSASGTVLWRRSRRAIPNDSGFALPQPARLNREGVPALAWADCAASEVVCVDARSGKLLWRLPTALSPEATVSIDGTGAKLWVPSTEGRLLEIDAATGNCERGWRFPQALATAPSSVPSQGALLQAGKEGLLYVVDLGDGKLKQILFLDHEPGDIRFPPVALGGVTVVAMDIGGQATRLQLLAVDSPAASGSSTWRAAGSVVIPGRIDMQPQVQGNLVLVATDLGAVSLYRLEGQASPRLSLVAARPPRSPSVIGATYAVFEHEHVWVADETIGYYRCEAKSRSGGDWKPDWQAPSELSIGRAIDSPVPGPAAGSLITVTRGPAGERLVQSVRSSGNEASLTWRTCVGVPLAKEPWLVEGDQIQALSTLPAFFQAERQAAIDADSDGNSMSSKLVELEPRVEPPAANGVGSWSVPRIHSVIAFSENGRALVGTNGWTQINVSPTSAPQASTRWVTSPVGSRFLAAAMKNALLVAGQSGEVGRFDPGSGAPLAVSYFPRAELSRSREWLALQTVSETTAVLADSIAGLHLVRLSEQPAAVVGAARTDLPSPIHSRMAALGEQIWLADASGTLRSFHIGDLTPGATLQLPGLCVWGPYAIGDRLLLAADNEELLSVGQDGKLQWKESLRWGLPVGRAFLAESEVWLASERGMIWRAPLTAASPAAQFQALAPLQTGPVVTQKSVFVASPDGVIYEIDKF